MAEKKGKDEAGKKTYPKQGGAELWPAGE